MGWRDLKFEAGGDEELRAQISKQKLLTTLRAFLEGNTHYPDMESSCDGCVALGLMEASDA